MGWREDQWAELQGVIADLEHKPVADAVILATLRRVSGALRADMPAPDRIAFARELLAGTGRVDVQGVGEAGGEVRIPDAPKAVVDACCNPQEASVAWECGWHDGWNACRAAMLEPDDAGG